MLRRSSEPCPAGSAVPVQRPPSARRAEASVQLAPAGPLPLLGDVSSRGLPASQPPLAALRWWGWPADRCQRPAWKLPQNCHQGHPKEPNQPKPTGCCQGRGVRQHPFTCWGGPGTPQPFCQHSQRQDPRPPSIWLCVAADKLIKRARAAPCLPGVCGALGGGWGGRGGGGAAGGLWLHQALAGSRPWRPCRRRPWRWGSRIHQSLPLWSGRTCWPCGGRGWAAPGRWERGGGGG